MTSSMVRLLFARSAFVLRCAVQVATTIVHPMRPFHLILCLAALGAPAVAQLDVAIVASAHRASWSCKFTDPQEKLLATGMFESVDIINTVLRTPTLAELLQYDACICYSNASASDGDAWGDVMADYVDAGGGVVVAVFANCNTIADRYLGGRWPGAGNEVILPSTGYSSPNSSRLGTVHDPGHPVMSGVSTFRGGFASFRPDGTAMTPGSTVIAEWNDGRILVAEGATPKRIDLGFYPPSNDCDGFFWLSTTDGDLMMANALAYVAGGGIPEPGTAHCFGNAAAGNPCPCGNDNDGTQPPGGCRHDDSLAGARLEATGIASVTADTVILHGRRGPISNATLFFQGTTDLDGAGYSLGDGIRCVGGGVIRLALAWTDEQGEATSWPTSITTRSASLGHPITPGETLHYQWWIRDPGGSPCGDESNTSNGYSITWGP